MDLSVAALLPVFIVCLGFHAGAAIRCTDKWNIYACYGGNKRSMPSETQTADQPETGALTPNLLRELLIRLRQADSEQDQLPVAVHRSRDVRVPPVDDEKPLPDPLPGRTRGAGADEEISDAMKKRPEWDSWKDRSWENDWRETAGSAEENVDAPGMSDDDDAVLRRLLRKWLNEIRTELSSGLLESDKINA